MTKQSAREYVAECLKMYGVPVGVIDDLAATIETARAAYNDIHLQYIAHLEAELKHNSAMDELRQKSDTEFQAALHTAMASLHDDGPPPSPEEVKAFAKKVAPHFKPNGDR
jgi:hypothetical protein